MEDITKEDDQYFSALQRIDVLEGEIEAQRQAIRLLREELLEASNIIEGLISSRWMKKSLEPIVEKFRSIATDGV